MNLEYFIAKRLIKGKEHKISISAPIIKIAIAAIAIGVIMMLIAIATGLGLKEKIREKVTAFNGHVQIYNYDNNNSEVSVVPVSIEQDFYPEFKTVDGIVHIQAVATKAGIIRTEETFEGIIAKGVGNDYNWAPFNEFLIEGTLPDYSGELNADVLISKIMANRLNLKVGDSFFTFFLRDDTTDKIPNQRKFTITGIYDSGFEEIDGLYIFTDIRHIQRMNKWTDTEVGNFEVFLNSFDDIDQKSNDIYGQTLSNLDTRTIKDKYHKIFEWIGLFDFNIALIIGIMIIVGGINMITALLVLILERTPMIGVLKALGMPNWDIRKVFLYNAAYLIGIGLFYGNLIGLGVIFIQEQFKVFKFPNPKEYYVEYIPVSIDLPIIVLLNIGVLLLCLLMLLIPSYIITKITPVKAIRFE
ncbi:FtsX-like permease family protein [Maribacter confluentis]|uniref:Lipoprotein-releasing system permease protein n=2 Tax=Maribacter TaxID=252356 RepID=A0ABY1SEP4_9FLAO|nr:MULTISPECIES: FtsX-like permease family protein [Maribacter]MDO1513656.1 FtsX-like permease family protein [Maribacter confluentis]SNR29999.1 lipoprotein-releasing system permease protein [Maribacter sedimenticola]